MENQETPEDPVLPMVTVAGSYKSRKFVLVIWGTLLIMVCGVLAAKWTAFAANLPSLLGALMGMLGLYFGANLTDVHLQNKANKDKED
jgi:hypothetical protein